MSKRLDIADKLKKLSKIKEKPSILKPRNAAAIEEMVEEPPTGVTKPPVQPGPMSIRNLAIPESTYELFSIEITSDSAEKEEITQLLSLREDPEVKLKWTVFRDPYMEEFDWLKRQGLVQIRDEPPIQGRDLDEGALVASHIGNYTFSMASRDLKTEPLMEFFILGLDNAKKYDLTAFTEKKHVLTKVNAAPKDDLEKSLQFKNQIVKKDLQIRNHLTQIEELKQELIQRERELSERPTEIDTLKKDVAKKDREIENYSMQIEEVKQALERKERELSEKSTEIDTLKKDVAKKDREIENYSMHIEEVKQDPKVAQLEGSISALKVSLEEKEDVITLRNSELDELKRSLASNEKELNNVKDKWRQADEQLKELTSGLEEKNGIVASKDGLMKTLTEEVKDLASRVDTMKLELEEKDRKIEEFDSSLGGIQTRLSGLKNIVGLDSRSREEIAKTLFGDKSEFTLEDELDIIIKEHQEKEKLLSAKATEVEGLKKQVEELTKAREESDFLYQEKGELLSAKDAEVEELKKQVEELTKAREDTDSLHQEKGELLSAKDAEVEELKKQVRELTKAHEVSDFLYQEKDELLNAKIVEVEELKKQVKELTKAHGDTDSLHQEGGELLSAKDAEIEELTKQVRELTKAHEERGGKPEALTKEGKKRILALEKRSAEKMLEGILTGRVNVTIAERRVRGRIYRKKIEDINKKIRELEEG